MPPVVFSNAAARFISKQEPITLFIRVWGITQDGGIAVEIYDSDLRVSDRPNNPFKDVEATEFVEDNVRLIVPNHHVDYVRGAMVDWTDDEDIREGDFVHGGFFSPVPNQVSTEGLQYTRGEVWEISRRMLWNHYSPRVFVDTGPGIEAYLEQSGKQWFSWADISEAVGAGHNSVADHGWFE